MNKVVMSAVVGLMVVASVVQAKPVVSIGTFKNKSGTPDKAFTTLLDRITNAIVNTRKFTVVDNARLKEAMDEQKKVEMGLSPETGAPKSGQFKVAGYVIYGTVLHMDAVANSIQLHGVVGTKMTATVELNIRFMNAENGELLASKIIKAGKVVTETRTVAQASVTNRAETAIQDAVQNAASKVVDSLMELAFPTVILKVSGKSVFVNLPEERVHSNDLLHVYTVGEALTDPDTGESLGASEELIGELKVVRTAPKFAVAVPIPPLSAEQLKKGMRVRPVSAEELADAAEKQQKTEAVSFRKRF